MAAAGLSMSSLWETVPEISGAFETALPRAVCKNEKLSQANRGEKASPALHSQELLLYPFAAASPQPQFLLFANR